MTRNSPEEEAALWIARLNSGEVTVDMLGELRSWMQESPENCIAFRQMEHLWSRLAIVQFAVRQIYAELDAVEH